MSCPSISRCSMVSERSSPSRARFARAYGALLTAAVRSEQKTSARKKWSNLIWATPRSLGARQQNHRRRVSNPVLGLVHFKRAKVGYFSKVSRFGVYNWRESLLFLSEEKMIR